MEEPRALTQNDKTKKNYKNIIIRTMDGSTIRGKLNIGTKERVSDLFTKTVDPFIVISDVEHGSGSGKELFLNKNSVVWIQPEDQ
jgi:small nuclear ribonucleoprotein (snRNP)-like protein